MRSFFLVSLFAFLGTQARNLPEHPSDKFMMVTNYESSSSSPLPSPTSSPTRQTIIASPLADEHSRKQFTRMAHHGRASSTPPPSPASSPPTQHLSIASPSNTVLVMVTSYERPANSPPPPPITSPPTRHVTSLLLCSAESLCKRFITMASPPPPKPSSPTGSPCKTKTNYGRPPSPLPPSPIPATPTHPVATIGLLLPERSTPNPNLAST
ncbi:hypothetical protein F0562_023161 [Nyssa sinensis]|uniref:Uncharacterized protein n=1 Tax=Nyssa sinensis TaxID=561372 RepID=A0A5J5BH19_9ASTE|nr:hypothetical protein F0562_023161 [Nyssa sinensis]